VPEVQHHLPQGFRVGQKIAQGLGAALSQAGQGRGQEEVVVHHLVIMERKRHLPNRLGGQGLPGRGQDHPGEFTRHATPFRPRTQVLLVSHLSRRREPRQNRLQTPDIGPLGQRRVQEHQREQRVSSEVGEKPPGSRHELLTRRQEGQPLHGRAAPGVLPQGQGLGGEEVLKRGSGQRRCGDVDHQAKVEGICRTEQPALAPALDLHLSGKQQESPEDSAIQVDPFGLPAALRRAHPFAGPVLGHRVTSGEGPAVPPDGLDPCGSQRLAVPDGADGIQDDVADFHRGILRTQGHLQPLASGYRPHDRWGGDPDPGLGTEPQRDADVLRREGNHQAGVCSNEQVGLARSAPGQKVLLPPLLQGQLGARLLGGQGFTHGGQTCQKRQAKRQASQAPQTSIGGSARASFLAMFHFPSPPVGRCGARALPKSWEASTGPAHRPPAPGGRLRVPPNPAPSAPGRRGGPSRRGHVQPVRRPERQAPP